jgi:hypothetical protein
MASMFVRELTLSVVLSRPGTEVLAVQILRFADRTEARATVHGCTGCGFADRTEARATVHGCTGCGFADRTEAALGHPWPSRHSCILHIIEGHGAWMHRLWFRRSDSPSIRRNRSGPGEHAIAASQGARQR